MEPNELATLFEKVFKHYVQILLLIYASLQSVCTHVYVWGVLSHELCLCTILD